MENKEIFNNKLEEFILENKNVFNFNNEKKVSSILLFKDYLFRLYSWKQELGIPFQFLKEKETHNIFQDLKVSWINDVPSYQEYTLLISKSINKSINNRYLNYLFIYLFILWDIFKDSEDIRLFSHMPPPYASIIEIIKANNGIYIQDGINVCDLLMKITVNFNLPSIEKNFLDYIDLKFKLEGSLGIPNQEEINRLWEDFNNINN